MSNTGTITIMCQVRLWAKLKSLEAQWVGEYCSRMAAIYGSEFNWWVRL